MPDYFIKMKSGAVNRVWGWWPMSEVIDIIDDAAGWWDSGEDDYPVAVYNRYGFKIWEA